MRELNLSKELYSEKDINNAISVFLHLADFKVSDGSRSFIVTINNCKYTEEETAAEFENYLIELTYGSMKNHDF